VQEVYPIGSYIVRLSTDIG